MNRLCQQPMFTENEDLPLFSGTCVSAPDSAFRPEPVAETVQDAVHFQALCLSSGTIASLIGDCHYGRIDEVQVAFARFAYHNPGRFTDWLDAWSAFKASSEYPVER